jgi:ribosomal protein S18 acetylase RimI-like enzyme
MVRWLDPRDVVAVGSVLGLARLYQGNGDYLVDWDGSTPTGHAHLAWTDPPELQDVEVRESYRRQGVATTLIRAAEAAARRRGCSRLRVTVSEDNDRARALYEGLGYADAGLAARRVSGTIQIRTGPIEVDDVLVTLERRLD